MRVVGVISSPSRNGNTAVLVREALRGAAERGAEVEEIFLAEHRLNFCTGCSRCLEVGRCHLPDDFEELKGKLHAADGVVLGSPTYGAEPNATMKNLFDRLGMLAYLTSAFGGKYAVGISTASGFGADATAKKLTDIVGMSVLFARGYVSGRLGVLRHGRRVEEQPEALAKARRLGIKLADDIAARRRYPFQNLSARLINALFVHKSIERAVVANRQGPMKAAYENLVGRGLIAPANGERTETSEEPARG
jgi:multimeric flavodoxin WrbA